MSRFAARTVFAPGRVYMEDVRGPRLFYCPDIVKFFQKYELDYAAFKREGIPFEALIATGDAMGVRAVQSAQQREREAA